MPRVRLQAEADHVETNLIHPNDPARAVIELVWNSLDADATRVDVVYKRNLAGAIEGVAISDNGHGIPAEECPQTFRRIGGSWKKSARGSLELGRPLHGKAGHGRLRAFALGTSIRWTTTAQRTSGELATTSVQSSSSSVTEYEVSEAESSAGPRGTLFESWGRQSSALNRLDGDSGLMRITAELAPYLMHYSDVLVVVDNVRIDPRSIIVAEEMVNLEFSHDGNSDTATLHIIEWSKDADERKIHYCDEKQIPVVSKDFGGDFPDFQFSAYVSWAGTRDNVVSFVLEFVDGSLATRLMKVAQKEVMAYLYRRRSQKRREQIQRWKDNNQYPYRDEPVDEAERVERATFDVIATAVSRHIPRQRQKGALALTLLKKSVRHDPEETQRLLIEVLNLSEDSRELLTQLLARTKLGNIIRASSSASNRLVFLAALDKMIFDPETASLVKERQHLHKILERELWVFGEEYNMMMSERSLNAVLDRHIEVLGRSRRDGPRVTRADGTHGRVDLMLSVAATEHDRARHLIVELKSPTVRATDKELKQIKSYARAVASDPRFADVETIWDFWLVVSDMDEDVHEEVRQENKPDGLAYESRQGEKKAKVRVWVKRWSEVLKEAENRLDYFKRNLQHDPSFQDALDYLRREHGDLIPEQMRADEQSSMQDGEGISA